MLNRSLIAMLLCLLVMACNERVDGCLDIQAENFAFDADDHDPGLCVYPNLILNVSYLWDTTSFQTGIVYEGAGGRAFVMHGVQILFSDFEITDSEGASHFVEDRVTTRNPPCPGGTELEVVDDYVFVDRTAFNYVVGGFRPSGQMAMGSVSAGVQELYCQQSFPVSHPLRSSRAGYREETADFAMGRFVVSLDSVNATRDTFFVYRSSEALHFPIEREFRRGKRDTLYMEIDFAEILRPVDWDASEDVITGKIGENIVAAVRAR